MVVKKSEGCTWRKKKGFVAEAERHVEPFICPYKRISMNDLTNLEVWRVPPLKHHGCNNNRQYCLRHRSLRVALCATANPVTDEGQGVVPVGLTW